MQQFTDHRGSLTSIKDIPFEVKEILVSKNEKNVLRGLHLSPYRKRVFVIKGTIYDFYIDPETGNKKEITLSAGDFVDIPKGWAHGFYSVDKSEIIYLLENKFDRSLDKNIFWNDPELILERKFPQNNLIISEKDSLAFYSIKYDFIVLGAKGFLGSNCVRILREQGYTVFECNARLDNIVQIRQDIVKSRATKLICAAGISGRPTVEWCETHEKETIKINYIDVIGLFTLTEELGIHCTYFGSGLVYNADKNKYTEEDTPNLTSRVYCRWRCELEKMVLFYKNVLYLRIIYPITGDGHPKCFLTKMSQRSSIVDTTVSLTIVPSLFPKVSELCNKSITGIYNFVNKGVIEQPMLVEKYTKNNFTLGTSSPGYELSTNKLECVIDVDFIDDALKTLMKSK